MLDKTAQIIFGDGSKIGTPTSFPAFFKKSDRWWTQYGQLVNHHFMSYSGK